MLNLYLVSNLYPDLDLDLGIGLDLIFNKKTTLDLTNLIFRSYANLSSENRSCPDLLNLLINQNSILFVLVFTQCDSNEKNSRQSKY